MKGDGLFSKLLYLCYTVKGREFLDQDGFLIQAWISELEIYLSILIPTGFCTCCISQLVALGNVAGLDNLVVSSQPGFSILHNTQNGS